MHILTCYLRTKSILRHRRPSVKETLPHNSRIGRSYIHGRLLLDLDPPRPDPADSGADPLADLAAVLPLELERGVNHDNHRDLPSILLYQRSYSVPRLPNITARTLSLQRDNPPILHRRLRHDNILLDLPL